LGGRDQKDHGSTSAWAKKVHETPISIEKKKLGMVDTHVYYSSHGGKHKTGELQAKLAWEKSETLSLK
jgi:hypothetical protein